MAIDIRFEGAAGKEYVSAETPLPVQTQKPEVEPVEYRDDVSAADVMVMPADGAECTFEYPGGDLQTGTTYKFRYVGVNAYGRTSPCDVVSHTMAGEGHGKVAFALTAIAAYADDDVYQSTPLDECSYYDIYFSTDADPKFLARITAAQLEAGCDIDSVDGVITVSSPGSGDAGTVTVSTVGTGQAAGTTAAVNTAYLIPQEVVDCEGYEYAHFDVTMTTTGDGASPACAVLPMLYNERTQTWYAGTAQTLAFGGAAGQYGSLKQRVTVSVRSNSAVAILVQSIAGTGATVDIDVCLS